MTIQNEAVAINSWPRSCDPRVSSAVARPQRRAQVKMIGDVGNTPSAIPWALPQDLFAYQRDFLERSILFWDTLRQRADNMLAHERAGKSPLLDFDYELILDARRFERPANYALLRITRFADDCLEDCLDPAKPPVIIIDPRAGHGPGIGGFKRDSEVGIALHKGYPVYFVIFFPNHVRARRWPMSCMRCAGLLRTYPSVMMVALRSCTAIARPAGQLLSSPLIAKDLSVPPFSMGRHCRIGLGNRASIRHELQADFWAEPGLPILLPILAMADSTAHGSFRISRT